MASDAPADADAAVPLSAQTGWLAVRRIAYSDEANGRGVFAQRPVPRGALVELAHCIRVPRAEHDEHLAQTVLGHYTYHCRATGDYLLALGLGSLFNHGRRPNLDYRVDAGADVIRYYAARDVGQGEELLIHYGGNLWFDDGSGQGRADDSDASDSDANPRVPGADVFS
eukprot:m51a1_g5787 putative histone lysine methyltransferase set7 (169) ;mRNA; r:27460-28168